MKEQQEESNDDLFKEAQSESIKKLIEKQNKVEDETIKEKLVVAIRERLEEGETQWDLLKKMLDGSLTERFIDIMYTMNDREFVRCYLKLLEYVKPKMTRIEGGTQEDNDVTVNIQTLIVNKQGEKEFVPINEIPNAT